MLNNATQWQLTGTAPEIYDKYVAPAVALPWYEQLAKSGITYMQGPIIDVGCGTGSFLSYLLTQKNIPASTEIVGLDLNIAMLDIAKKKPTLNNISWINSDVEDIPFKDNHFKLLYCQQGMQYFKDKAKSFEELYRVTHPDGILIATVWSKIEDCIGYQYLANAALKILGNKAEQSLLAPFSYSNSDQLRFLAQAAGFQSVEVEIIDKFVHFKSIQSFVWHRIFGSPLVESLPKNAAEEAIMAIAEELEMTLKEYQSVEGLRFPVKANYLCAKKYE